MANALAQLFLQNLIINDTPINRDLVLSCAYIEIDYLEGPQIEIAIRDTSGRLSDQLGIKYGSTMTATLGDPQGATALWQDTFFILEAPSKNNIITVVALVDAVRKLHAPAGKALFFTNSAPADILGQLTQNQLAAVTDGLNAATSASYHLNSGDAPADVVRKLAKDNGALCAVSKSRILVKSIKNILQSPPLMRYEANNPRADYRINRFQILNADYAASQAHDYRYVGFSQTEGVQSAGGDAVPVKMVGDVDPNVLKNHTIGLIPKLDIEIQGNPGISVGDVLGVKLNANDAYTANDQIPPYMVVMRITHYETRFNYRSRVILGVTYDQLKGLDGMQGGGALGGSKDYTGGTGFNIDGFDMGAFLDKISQGVEPVVSTLTDAMNMVNQAEQTITDAVGNVTKIVTNELGEIEKTFNDAVGSAVKEVTDRFGNVTKTVTDALGNEIKTVTDKLGNILSTTHTPGTGGGSGTGGNGNPPHNP